MWFWANLNEWRNKTWRIKTNQATKQIAIHTQLASHACRESCRRVELSCLSLKRNFLFHFARTFCECSENIAHACMHSPCLTVYKLAKSNTVNHCTNWALSQSRVFWKRKFILSTICVVLWFDLEQTLRFRFALWRWMIRSSILYPISRISCT